MSKLKLMSVLQSRISNRRALLSSSWEFLKELPLREAKVWKERILDVSLEQKQDKQILKQLIVDERELKLLKECAKKLQGRIDTLLGWNK
jgi:hypothetical protein